MIKYCVVCKVPFKTYRSRDKTCCRLCALVERKMRTNKKIVVTCCVCDRECIKYKSALAEHVCCSNRCRHKIAKKNLDVFCEKENKKAKRRYKYIKKNGKRMLEHRAVMEEYVGRPLDSHEHVHHINNDPSDNRLENLQILDRSSHSRLTATENYPFQKIKKAR